MDETNERASISSLNVYTCKKFTVMYHSFSYILHKPFQMVVKRNYVKYLKVLEINLILLVFCVEKWILYAKITVSPKNFFDF